MTNHTIHYFGRGNTAQGLFSLTDSIFQGVKTIYVVDGYPGGTEAFLKGIEEACHKAGRCIQLIHQPLDERNLDGIIIDDGSTGIISREAWGDGLVYNNSDINVNRINLTEEVLDHSRLSPQLERVKELEGEIDRCYQQAFDSFHRTLRIHDDWEKIYIDSLDREKMNQLAVDWCEQYLQQEEPSGKEAIVVHRFLGAATWRGAVDYVPNLTGQLRTRIFVKGRPGSGKSTLFKKIADTAEQKGWNTEVYHCGFDSNSLDMLIFPELSLAIFDSTAPHEHFPSREGDHILDIYGLAIEEGTDEQYAKEICTVQQKYSDSMRKSISYLAEVKKLRDELAHIYKEVVDEAKLSGLQDELWAKLNR